MKIAFFQPYLAAWRIEFLERFIKETAHDVIVYDGGFKSKKDPKSVSNNIKKFASKVLWNFPWVLKYSNQEYPIYFSPSLIFHLFRDRPKYIVTEGEINIINNLSIILFCFLTKSKYVWWSLGKVRTRKKTLINRLFDNFVKFGIIKADIILVRNSLAREYYINKYNISTEKIVLAPNSMDEIRAKSEIDPILYDRLRANKKGNIILYSGALTKAKRPLDLILALEKLLDKSIHKDIMLWFIGDGPEICLLKDKSEELGLLNNIKFLGRITNGVGSYFSVADIVVVPGLGGLAINHAMIFGCPVICRVADGTEYDLIINGKTGYILNDYDNDNLAQCIDKVIEDNKEGAMSKAALDIIENKWNMEIMIKNIDSIF